MPIAKATGVTEEQVAAMEDWEAARCFSELGRLVLRFTDEVAQQVKGSRATLAALARTLKPAEIVELIVSIGFWGMVARLLETTEVELEPFAGKIKAMAYRNQFDAGYLLSADGDFTSAVQFVRDQGKKLYVASSGRGAQLAKVANNFIPLKPEWFADCYR